MTTQPLWTAAMVEQIGVGGSPVVGRRQSPIAFDAVRSQLANMPYHRFKVGQTVVAPSEGRDLHIPRGPLVVVRLLPLADGEPQYRVRSEADGHDRVVLERQIRPPDEPKPSPAEPPRPKPARMRRKD
jgi:hypothetical protein